MQQATATVLVTWVTHRAVGIHLIELADQISHRTIVFTVCLVMDELNCCSDILIILTKFDGSVGKSTEESYGTYFSSSYDILISRMWRR